MALKNGKPNLLNALEVRKVAFPAHHFYYTSIPKHNTALYLNINNWIYHNLNSRYYIGQSIELIDTHLTYVIRIGFEQEKELSFFSLACPYLL